MVGAWAFPGVGAGAVDACSSSGSRPTHRVPQPTNVEQKSGILTSCYEKPHELVEDVVLVPLHIPIGEVFPAVIPCLALGLPCVRALQFNFPVHHAASDECYMITCIRPQRLQERGDNARKLGAGSASRISKSGK